MDKQERLAAFFGKKGPYQEGLATLRNLLQQTELQEHFKWSAPVYTMDGENVCGLMAFKNHFGLWFFNGVFLSDPLGVLTNAQEGKTKAMRHWKFQAVSEIDPKQVRAYVLEAIALARKGVKLAPAPPRELVVPERLQAALTADPGLLAQFEALAPYKQRDYAEYIEQAKQEATRERRMAKILPMIRQGLGLNDKYRNC